MATVLKRLLIALVASLTLATTMAAMTRPAAAWGGWGWGWGAGAGFLGGLALGTAIAGPHYYGYGYPYYGGCYVVRRPVYDYYGNFLGYRPMRQCY